MTENIIYTSEKKETKITKLDTARLKWKRLSTMNNKSHPQNIVAGGDGNRPEEISKIHN